MEFGGVSKILTSYGGSYNFFSKIMPAAHLRDTKCALAPSLTPTSCPLRGVFIVRILTILPDVVRFGPDFNRPLIHFLQQMTKKDDLP